MTGTDPGPPEAPEVRRGPGRPRDPDLEARALEATLAVFGERGWTGLTIEEVSSRARVGKSSIYLRWKDKETLLAAALRHSQQEPEADGDLEERHRVAAAIRAGDLASDASPVQILDAVEGAIFMHILVTPPHLVDRVRRNLPDYITTMVDNQLRAASPVSPRGT